MTEQQIREAVETCADEIKELVLDQIQGCTGVSVTDYEPIIAKHIQAILALAEAEPRVTLTAKAVRAAADWFLKHGDLDNNAHCLTYQILKQKAEQALELGVNVSVVAEAEQPRVTRASVEDLVEQCVKFDGKPVTKKIEAYLQAAGVEVVDE